MDGYADLKQGEKGAWVSIAAYILLSVFKVGAGFYFASEALTADGMNNMSDVFVSVAVLIGLRIAQKPPDTDHPYGHFKAETIAALIASVVMAGVAVNVLWGAMQSLFAGERPAPDLKAGWIAIAAAIAMFAVYMYNRKLAEKLDSRALHAAAHDNRSDAFVSIGAAVGIFGSQLGLPWLDPLAAVAVSIVIGKTAWDIFKSSTHALTDGFEEDKLDGLRATIGRTPGVTYTKDIRARVYGSRVLLDVIVEVDPNLNVIESHGISEHIEKRLKAKHKIMEVHVHIEPGDVPERTP
ncbi:cation diffusion facilitator family transporter [Paenibacillus sp. GYB004]|uniref:cation diffusion facilitator family transporter n=1 Tax=Paenibacillus sp. GYB004 TaxID=2994393 RepID=UPI002F96E5DB